MVRHWWFWISQTPANFSPTRLKFSRVQRNAFPIALIMMAACSLDQEHYYYFVVLKASQNTSERFENSFVNTVVSPVLYEIFTREIGTRQHSGQTLGMRKGINFAWPRAQSFCASTRQQTYESTAGALTVRRHFIKKFMFPERLCLFYNLVSGSSLRVYWWQVSCFLMVDQSDLGTPKPCINKQMKIAELIKDKSSILWWA